MLLYVGEFRSAVNQLLQAQNHVEATTLAMVLSEMNLLATKQTIFEIVSDRSQENVRALQVYSENDLAVIMEQSIDLDA